MKATSSWFPVFSSQHWQHFIGERVIRAGNFFMVGGILTLFDTFQEIDNCVTAPQGFRAGITACGIKSDGSIPDLAILASDVPCIASGTFTTSSTRAAPVLVCQEHLKSARAQAVDRKSVV